MHFEDAYKGFISTLNRGVGFRVYVWSPLKAVQVTASQLDSTIWEALERLEKCQKFPYIRSKQELIWLNIGPSFWVRGFLGFKAQSSGLGYP